MRVLGVWVVAAILAGPTVASDIDRLAPGRRAGRDDSRALAARIDEVLASHWSEAGIKPAPRASDGEFLRRVSLDLVGKIPTASEARDFLDDPDPGKREALVDRLLDSPAYAARAVVLWRRLLLPDADDQVRGAAGGLDAWLRRKGDEEAGYDRIVREILTARLDDEADGMARAQTASGPSPAAFFAAKGGKPETLAGDTARAFLGLRLECAQCHNHPFAKWKREEFWGYAAFFAAVPRPADDGTPAIRGKIDANLRELTIPGTSTVVKATHLDHTPPAWRPRADTRLILAEWVTRPDNPYFARAAVNRVWARFFGPGLIEPVDDLDAAESTELGGLLDEVAARFRDRGYDMKFLIRTLTATRAYHLTSAVEPSQSASAPLFSRMPVRGLSPSQLIESLAQATGVDPAEQRARFLELFADRDERPTEAQTSILQALTLMNGAFVAGATSPVSGDLIGAISGAPYLDTAGRVEVLYLAALTRRPRPNELAVAVKYVDRRANEADRSRALADVFWALLNGAEFRLNH